jgi:hypothetical protein
MGARWKAFASGFGLPFDLTGSAGASSASAPNYWEIARFETLSAASGATTRPNRAFRLFICVILTSVGLAILAFGTVLEGSRWARGLWIVILYLAGIGAALIEGASLERRQQEKIENQRKASTAKDRGQAAFDAYMERKAARDAKRRSAG